MAPVLTVIARDTAGVAARMPADTPRTGIPLRPESSSTARSMHSVDASSATKESSSEPASAMTGERRRLLHLMQLEHLTARHVEAEIHRVPVQTNLCVDQCFRAWRGTSTLLRGRAVELTMEQTGEAKILQRLLRILEPEQVMRPRVAHTEHRAAEECGEPLLLVLPALTG